MTIALFLAFWLKFFTSRLKLLPSPYRRSACATQLTKRHFSNAGNGQDNPLPMALITLLNAQLAYGHVALLDHTDFALESGERVGLIGRNGAGKSSFLKILSGLEKADDGA